MDAKELSLPVNVTFRLMDSEDLDRDGEIKARSLPGKEASACNKGSTIGSCRIECSKNKKADEDSCVHAHPPALAKCEDINKVHDIAKFDGHTHLSPNQERKLLGRKYSKRLTSVPSKKPRFDDVENSMKELGAGGHHNASSNAGLNSIRCTLSDKSQIAKLKRAHDGRKADKKLLRASVKNKYDSLTSKAILTCSDTFSGGSNIFGSQGSKSDVHSFAKSLNNELPLREFLDGSYKFPKLPMDKGKKSSNSNDGILLSIRKACSILCPPPHAVADNTCHVKACQSSHFPTVLNGSSSDCEAKDKQLEELLAKTKDHVSLQTNSSESTMLHPKNILEQLELPAVNELEAVLFNSSMASGPVQLTSKARSCSYTGMLPFPWSFSHGGNSKSNVEFCKVNSTKCSCQGKWTRIGSSSISTEGNKSFLSVFKEHENVVHSSNQSKVDDAVQKMRSFTPILLPLDGLSSKPTVVETHTEAEFLDAVNSVHESGVSLDNDSKDHASGLVSRCEMNPSTAKFNLLKDKAVLECKTGSINACSVSKVNSGSNCSSWQLSNWDKHWQGLHCSI